MKKYILSLIILATTAVNFTIQSCPCGSHNNDPKPFFDNNDDETTVTETIDNENE